MGDKARGKRLGVREQRFKFRDWGLGLHRE